MKWLQIAAKLAVAYALAQPALLILISGLRTGSTTATLMGIFGIGIAIAVAVLLNIYQRSVTVQRAVIAKQAKEIGELYAVMRTLHIIQDAVAVEENNE